MKVSALLVTAAVLVGCAPDSGDEPGPDYTKTFDLALVGGTVVDGSGAPAARQDVLIDGDRIDYVGPVDASRLTARDVIDASGLTITPGFIDTHAHGDPLTDGTLENFLVQGVTTVVLGQDGRTPGGYSDAPIALAEWMRRVEESGTHVNVAALVGHGTIRNLSGVGIAESVSPEQLGQMRSLLLEGLNAGAFGMSTGLEYVPGRYARLSELETLARTTGRADGVVMSHLRSEDADKIEAAIDELIAQGRHARVHVSHLKIVFADSPAQAESVLTQIRAAREAGIEISADVYPYLAGFADMTLVYPPWAKTRAQWAAAVSGRRAELEDYLHERVLLRGGPGAILLASGDYAGLTLEEASQRAGIDFVSMLIDEFGYGGPNAAHFIMNEAVQDEFILAPDVAISTDGGPWIRHPRSWGSYPRVIRRYVLTGRLPLETAIRKMTALPADLVGLDDRGRIASGMKADILVLDLDALTDRATWTEHDLPPAGFEWILVNGEIARRAGTTADDRHGRLLRRTTPLRAPEDAL